MRLSSSSACEIEVTSVLLHTGNPASASGNGEQ
jgi:hypothetical protein